MGSGSRCPVRSCRVDRAGSWDEGAHAAPWKTRRLQVVHRGDFRRASATSRRSGEALIRETSSRRDREGAGEASWNRVTVESVARPLRRFHAVSPRRSGKLPGTLPPGRGPEPLASVPSGVGKAGREAIGCARQDTGRPPSRSARCGRSKDAGVERCGLGDGDRETGRNARPGSRDLPPGGPFLKGSHPVDGSPEGTPFRAWAACTGLGKRPCVPSCFPSGTGETR